MNLKLLLTKLILLILICSALSFSSLNVWAQDSGVSSARSRDMIPKPFLNSVLYGTGAGTILGFVVTGTIPGLLRGASLGLYGGILLGWYVSSIRDSSDYNSDQVPAQSDFQPKTSPLQFKFTFNF